MTAGELRERVAFDQLSSEDTDFGIANGDYEEQFRRDARIRPLIGSEPVIAQRLTGVQPVVIKVRSDSSTRMVTTAWRIRDVRSGTDYNVRAVTPDEKRIYIEFLCESGVATNA